MYVDKCRKTIITFFQISLSTATLEWASGSVVMTIQFRTTFGKILGKYGTLQVNAYTGSVEGVMQYDASVPGKKLAFISGTQGSAIDSLTFYFN